MFKHVVYVWGNGQGSWLFKLDKCLFEDFPLPHWISFVAKSIGRTVCRVYLELYFFFLHSAIYLVLYQYHAASN